MTVIAGHADLPIAVAVQLEYAQDHFDETLALARDIIEAEVSIVAGDHFAYFGEKGRLEDSLDYVRQYIEEEE